MAFPGKRPEVNAAMTLPAVATAIAPSYTEGDCVPLSIDLAGKLRTDSTGGGGGGEVTNAGTFAVQATSLIPGTSATNLGKAEDAAHASGDTGVFILGVRNDAGTTTFGANGDYGPIATGAGGQVLTQELGRAAVIHFQAAIPTTASGTALASNACKEATVKNLLSNTAIIWVGVSGVSAANGYELNPGEAITLKVSNTNLIYCLSASGTINVCVIATN
jgi:hypothetical protein